MRFCTSNFFLYNLFFFLFFFKFVWIMCFPFSNSVEKNPLISEYRNNLFLILLIIFVLPGKFEFDLGEISNFLCFISLKFHFSLAVCPNSQQVRYSILRSLLVSRNISSSNLSDLSESLFQYFFFFFYKVSTAFVITG